MATKKKAEPKEKPEAKPDPQVFIDTGFDEPTALDLVCIDLHGTANSIDQSQRTQAEKFRHFAGHLRDIAAGLDKQAQELSLQG